MASQWRVRHGGGFSLTLALSRWKRERNALTLVGNDGESAWQTLRMRCLWHGALMHQGGRRRDHLPRQTHAGAGAPSAPLSGLNRRPPGAPTRWGHLFSETKRVSPDLFQKTSSHGASGMARGVSDDQQPHALGHPRSPTNERSSLRRVREPLSSKKGVPERMAVLGGGPPSTSRVRWRRTAPRRGMSCARGARTPRGRSPCEGPRHLVLRTRPARRSGSQDGASARAADTGRS